ncbi:MAG: ceramidase [Turneriella sp.]|nr:ceramidase [Turneriella sp.]
MPLPDYGPLYRETNPNAVIKEPWNMASAALFIVLALYWLIKLHGRKDFRFQYWLNWGLLVGGIGGTLFHGLRAHFIFLAMDFIPILVLSIALAFHFWFRILKRRIYVFWPLAILFSLRFAIVYLGWERSTQIALSYATLGIFILLPVLLFLIKVDQQHGGWVALAVVFFAAALFFRSHDFAPWLAKFHGGHWLWHVLAAQSVASIEIFLYKINPALRPACSA